MLGYTYRYIKGYIGGSGREIRCILRRGKGGKGKEGERRILRSDYIIKCTVLTLYLYGGLAKYLIFNIISILNACSISISIQPYIDIEY